MAPVPNPDLRNPRSHRAILDAALELAARDGYAKVTVEAIAAAAGVGKQTIYRWWPSKAAVVLEALNDRTGPFSGVPDTGDVVADMVAAAQGVIEALGTDLGTIWRGLVADAQGDARLAATCSPSSSNRATRAGRTVSTRPSRLSELRADVPTRTMVELLFGPVYYRLLLGTDPLDPDDTTARVEWLLNGLRAR
ncbi:TetR/AcrR family transcriptional regulator [Kitasatospora arboriphila]